MYEIVYEAQASKAIEALPRSQSHKLVLKIESLSDNPRPPGCRKIMGAKRDLYRIRAGRFRIVYEIRDRELIVLVVHVGRRDERTYRSL